MEEAEKRKQIVDAHINPSVAGPMAEQFIKKDNSIIMSDSNRNSHISGMYKLSNRGSEKTQKFEANQNSQMIDKIMLN